MRTADELAESHSPWMLCDFPLRLENFSRVADSVSRVLLPVGTGRVGQSVIRSNLARVKTGSMDLADAEKTRKLTSETND